MSVLTMPTVRFTAVLLPSLERRMELLRWLAAHADGMEPESVANDLAAWATPDLGPAEREIAWRGYQEAARVLEDVKSGVLDWRVVNDELTCCDRQEAAREIAAQDEENALAVLAGATTKYGGIRNGA